jgi:RNA polymerase sigma-70 factor, ECF subfamily
MTDGLTDAALIAAAVRGRREAFSEIVKRHQGTVFRIALRILRDEAAANDAAQEAFLKAFRNLQSFDTARPFAPWLYRIARNHSLDVVRSRRASPELLESASRAGDEEEDEGAGAVGRDVADDAPDAFSQVASAELAKRIGGALERLDPKYREVIELYHYENLTYDEIAGTLNVPIGTVMTRIFRARQKLAVLLQDSKGEYDRNGVA